LLITNSKISFVETFCMQQVPHQITFLEWYIIIIRCLKWLVVSVLPFRSFSPSVWSRLCLLFCVYFLWPHDDHISGHKLCDTMRCDAMRCGLAWIGWESGSNRAWIVLESGLNRAQIGFESDFNRAWIVLESGSNRVWIEFQSGLNRVWIGFESGLNWVWIWFESDLDRIWIWFDMILLNWTDLMGSSVLWYDLMRCEVETFRGGGVKILCIFFFCILHLWCLNQWNYHITYN
jgi:hypothetical protein